MKTELVIEADIILWRFSRGGLFLAMVLPLKISATEFFNISLSLFQTAFTSVDLM